MLAACVPSVTDNVPPVLPLFGLALDNYLDPTDIAVASDPLGGGAYSEGTKPRVEARSETGFAERRLDPSPTSQPIASGRSPLRRCAGTVSTSRSCRS
jgi:hypothetical protein